MPTSSAPVVLGRDVVMGPGCTIIGMNHNTARTDVPMIQQGYHPKIAPVIEDDVCFGAHVTILPGKRIGTGSIVAAGAVVARGVPPFTVVGGNPASVIRGRT
jgi:maltose O-acetyltransferase